MHPITLKKTVYNRLITPEYLAKKTILHETKGSTFYITFNRPQIYNAFDNEMYVTFGELIEVANQMQQIKFIVIRGAGGNFSSGNDNNNFFSEFRKFWKSDQARCKYACQKLGDLTLAIVNSHKPIFALVEGLAVGFAFTQLGLYDRVFAVENASFMAPLVKLAQGQQMCASYTFPKVFGLKVAEDLIIKGQRVNAKFLQKFGFLTTAPNKEEASKLLESHIAELDELDWKSYINARRLFRADLVEKLKKATKYELDNLYERWMNPDLPELITKYMKKVRQNRNKPKL